MTTVVGLGEMAVTSCGDTVLVTHSLGSCLGLSLFDPVACIGGLVHCMLPLSSADPERARRRPCLYTDTGVAELLRAVFDRGAARRDLVAVVAGGACFDEGASPFRVGDRNWTVLRKVLWKNGVLIAEAHVGGASARTLHLDTRTGKTTVQTDGAPRVDAARPVGEVRSCR